MSRVQLGAEWVCQCENLECPSSSSLVMVTHNANRTNRFYDINREIVLGLRLVGPGYSAAQKILSILNLSGPISSASRKL